MSPARHQGAQLGVREEILAVIAKHVSVERDKVRVTMDRGDAVSTLEVDIEIPTPAGPARLAVGA